MKMRKEWEANKQLKQQNEEIVFSRMAVFIFFIIILYFSPLCDLREV